MSDEWNMQDAYTRQKSKIIRARKPRARRRVVICSHQADSPLYVGLVSDLVICKFRKKYGHTWHRISLMRQGVTKQ